MNVSPHIAAQIQKVETNALAGSGQSDVLFESRCQAGYAAILANAPENERINVEAVLKECSFDPDYKEYEPKEGECSLTGIDIDCCPCGRHP